MRIKIHIRQSLICAITLISLMFASNTAGADTVVSNDFTSDGRIKTVSAGLIIIRDNGSDLTYKREVNNDYFDDAVAFKKYFFTKKIYELTGRVESVDRLNAVIYTKAGKVEIQRYKIKNIIMKVPNRGF